jgi:hypothetical protein
VPDRLYFPQEGLGVLPAPGVDVGYDAGQCLRRGLVVIIRLVPLFVVVLLVVVTVIGGEKGAVVA